MFLEKALLSSINVACCINYHWKGYKILRLIEKTVSESDGN